MTFSIKARLNLSQDKPCYAPAYPTTWHISIYRARTLDTSFRLRGVFEWLLYSLKYTQNSSLHQVHHNFWTPHWHPMVLVYSPIKGLGFIDELLLENEELPRVLGVKIWYLKHFQKGGSWILKFLVGTPQDHLGPSPKTIKSTWFGQGGPLELLQIWVVSDDPNWANFGNSLAWPS